MESSSHRHTPITPFFSPGPTDQPGPPIYVAAVNPWMYRMAGEVADGVHVHPFHSSRYLDEIVLPAMDEGLQRSGRTRADMTLGAPVFGIATDDAVTEKRMTNHVRQL